MGLDLFSGGGRVLLKEISVIHPERLGMGSLQSLPEYWNQHWRLIERDAGKDGIMQWKGKEREMMHV